MLSYRVLMGDQANLAFEPLLQIGGREVVEKVCPLHVKEPLTEAVNITGY